MSLNSRTEEYYKKFIELQEKLRKSEEERLKLEIKFNEMLQITREEEQMHYRKLRSQYKRFLEEDRRRQDRNERILRALERIENRVSLLVAKTERFKLLRQQYQTFLDRIYKVNQLKKVSQPREEITVKVQPPTEEKSDLVQSYIQNLSSQKLRDMLSKEEISRTRLPFTTEQKPKQEYFLSDESEFRPNYASYIADDIMNSIHSRHKIDDSNNTPLREQNNNLGPKPFPQTNDFEQARKSYDDQMKDIYQGSFPTKPSEDSYSDDLSETSVDSVKKSFETSRPNMKVSKETDKNYENVPYKATERPHKQLENFNYDTTRTEIKIPPPAINDDVKMYQPINQTLSNETLPVETNKQTILQKHESTDEQEIQRQPYDQTENVQLLDDSKTSKEVSESGKRTLEEPHYENEPSKLQEQEVAQPSFSDKPKTGLPKSETLKDNEDIELMKDEHVVGSPQSVQGAAYDYENQHHYQLPEHEKTPLYEKEKLMENRNGVVFEQPQYNEPGLDQQYDESGQPVQTQGYDSQFVQEYDDHGQFIQPYDETGQPIQTGQLPQQQYDQNLQPIQQYHENRQPIQTGQLPQQQYDQNLQPTQQYDENGQPIQQQYDENVQPIQQYDENGQPIQQYDENGQRIQQQYDQNLQPIQQYDENGQPAQQHYDQNVQPIHQYDENGQPIQQQYDQSGQPLQQYDENGQPIQQYDENGQPIQQQYDENVQPIQQYDENGQPIQQQYDQSGPYDQHQYDENGQPIQQYDENGQPILQYDENGQPIQQYDENGQPIQQHYELYQQYDEQGQLQQYDSSGQLISQYDENGQLLHPYSEIQYDENGQIIQYETSGQDPSQLQYSASGDVQQYDEHGNPIQFETDQQLHQQSYEEKPEMESTPVENVSQENLRNPNDTAARTSNVMEMLDTDSESVKQTTKVSNDSDFDFSNG